ncbi:Pentatricopeptide repeat-containing protein [Quillaja saponaria]|uniref:Pentatricopeptide repeat-containing protein n=1 Tax=Quillaja saponaria TaxID=32244 RepID=A0AAD7PER6_QUISA|nr:Pentatricopeptide repeat-containing protein [Quillaja saponaria]
MPLPPLYETSPFGVLSLVQKCTSISSLKKARQLHALILATTTVSLRMPFVHNNILSMYARSGSLKDSQLVFDKMPQRNIVSFNALITAYSRVPDHAISAIKLYTQMESGCQSPNSLTFTSLLQASSLLEDLLAGSSLHAQAVKFGFLDEICVQTSLLGMYSNCGNLGSAEKVFVDISDKDVVAWNSLILGNLKNGNIRAGLQGFVDMVRVGVVPTEFTYSMILNACSRLNDNQLGQLIHAQIIVTNMLADLPLQNVLLDMYCNSGDTQTASRIFSGMESTDLVSWNSMISGYSEKEEVENAMNLFVQLLGQCSPKPDEYTYAALICATNSFPASDYGKPLHAQVMKTGHEGSVFVGSTLVCMYFKNGETEAAQKVFCSISHKDIVLCTEMIAGYSRMADPRRAISFYSEMCHKGYEGR